MSSHAPRPTVVKERPSGIKDSLWFNILIMIGVAVLLYFLIFSSLSIITQHGAEVKVPSVTDRPLDKALATLEKAGFAVDIDSSYDAERKPLAVLTQQPAPGAVVKQNRTIFLTVNKALPPATQMPNLVNLSFRSASLILKSRRLVLGDTIMKPDIARGAVLEERFAGRVIAPGTNLAEGSRIDLVVGDGLGEVEFDVPDVIGMTYNEGRALLMGNGLYLVPVFDGPLADTGNAIIYNQVPSPYNEGGGRNRKRQGDYVDVFVKKSPTVEEMESNRKPKPAVMDMYAPEPATPKPATPKPVSAQTPVSASKPATPKPVSAQTPVSAPKPATPKTPTSAAPSPIPKAVMKPDTSKRKP